MLKETPEASLVILPSPFLADEKVFPFLGLLKVASALEQKEVPIDVIDLSGISNPQDAINDYLKGAGKGVTTFGLTATTPQFPQAVKLAGEIKKEVPEARVILGGPHATMVGTAYEMDQKRGVEGRGTQAYRQMTEIFDTTVIGDGEEAVMVAIREDAPKVIDAGNLKSQYFIQRGKLENYPFPARHLVDLDSYHYQIDGKDAQSLIAQLGCPFECGFCGGRDSQVFRVARTRSIESIMAEVEELVEKYGKRGVMFYDDELNISDKNITLLMEELIRYQEKQNIELRLRGFVKAELFTPHQAELMYRAGFRILLSGVESGSNKILETMRKHTSRDINSQWVVNCHNAGIQAKALMSLGHPSESEETVFESLEWVIQNHPDDVDWTIITQYPGSPYFDHSTPHPVQEGTWVYTEPKTGGVLYSQNVDFSQKAEYYKGVPGDYSSYVWTDQLSPNKLVKLRDYCEETSRSILRLPRIVAVASMQFDHSMGQSKLIKSSRPK